MTGPYPDIANYPDSAAYIFILSCQLQLIILGETFTASLIELGPLCGTLQEQ